MLRSSDTPVLTPTVWRPSLLALAAGLLMIVGVFAPTWLSMANIWATSETYGHGMAVAPIALWLVWRQRERLARLSPKPAAMGLVGLALACLVWLVADLAGINVLAHLAVTAMVLATVLSVMGWRVAAAVAFPLAFLFFMVPGGEGLNPLLMESTANATIWGVQASGIPVFREGLHFTLPTGRWSVVEACSGLRYVLAAAMLGALFAYLNFSSWQKRSLFFVTSVLVSVVANWMRAYLIVMLGHFSNMRWGTGDDHVVYGWVFFGLMMFALFWMGAKWRDETPLSATPIPARRSALPVVEQSSQAGQSMASTRRTQLTWIMAGIMLVSVLTPIALGRLRHVPIREDLGARAADTLGAFQRASLALQPAFAGARGTVQGQLPANSGVELFQAYFASQTEGNEMVAHGNGVILDSDKSWSVMSARPRVIEVDGREIPVKEILARSSAAHRLVWTWYTVGGQDTHSESRSKLLTALAMLTGKGDHATVSVVSVPIDASVAGLSESEMTRLRDEAFSRAKAGISGLERLSRTMTVR